MGVANGERQIKIAGRGASVMEKARADYASYSSAYFAGTSIGKGPTRAAFRSRSSATPAAASQLSGGACGGTQVLSGDLGRPVSNYSA